MDVCSLAHEEASAIIWFSLSETEKTTSFAKELAGGASEKIEILDELIVKYAQNWELKRMAALDRNILLLTSYELLFNPHTPVSVIIDEGVEMAKQYSTPDSGKFVNGILDKIKNERRTSSHEK